MDPSQRKISPADLETLRKFFVPYAKAGLGEIGTDTVFTRSFALLNLKELAAADLQLSFLTTESFDGLLVIPIDSLTAERDSRGYVADRGWAHATAHAGDLARILARNRHLSAAQQPRLVHAIAQRTRRLTGVFVWGEDARLAKALPSVAMRDDADIGAFET